MADDLNLPQQARGDTTSYYTPENMQRELDEMLADDPSVLAGLSDTVGTLFQPAQEDTTPPAGRWARLWRRLRGAESTYNRTKQNLGTSIIRGGLRAADELSNAVVGLGASFVKNVNIAGEGTTLNELLNDEQGEQDFLLWYEQRTKDVNPLQFGEERINRWFPQPEGFGYALVEGVSQFAAGAGVLKAATAGPAAVTAAPKIARYLKLAAGGAVVDLTFFDPYAERLSNLIENGPEWMRNRFTEFLAADGDDSAIEGRLKNALEGLVIGETLDGFIRMARGARAVLRHRAGKLSEKAAQDVVTAVVMQTEHHAVADAFIPVPDGNGKWAVVPNPKALGDEAALLSIVKDRTPEQNARLKEISEQLKAEGETIQGTPDLESSRAAKPEVPEPISQDIIQRERRRVQVPVEVDRRIQNMQESGFAEGKPAAGVEVPIQGGYPKTVDVVKQAQEIVGGPEELTRLAREEIARRGGAEGDLEIAGASLEDTARRIVNEHGFPSEASAQQAAASGNFYRNNGRRPTAFTPEMAQQWKQVADRLAAGESAEDIARLMQGTDFNFNYISQPREVLAAVEAMAEVLPSEIRMQGKAVQTHAQTIALAKGMFKNLDGEQVVEGAARMFKSTENLPQKILALRAWLVAQGKVARKLSQLAEAAPDNAIAHDQLMAALDTMGDLYGHLSGTVSNVARTLEQQKIRVASQTVNPAVKQIESSLDDLRSSRTVHERMSTTGDQEAITAANTQLQRALDRAEEALKKKLKRPKADSKNPIEELNQALDEADRQLQQQLDKAKSSGTKAPRATSPVSDFIKSNKAPSNGRRVAAGRTKAELRALARQVFLADGDPAEILAAITTPRMPVEEMAKAADARSIYRKFWDGLIGYRYEAMLSGPRTQVINATSNAVVAVQRPVEYWWAGRRFSKPELEEAGGDMLVNMSMGIGESWRAAKKAWSLGRNVLDPGNTHTGRELAPWGEASWASKVFHIPSRLLMTTDEFFKQLNYRTNLRAQILNSARREGVTDATALSARLSDDMQFAVNEATGQAVNPLSLEYARVGTFTNSLEEGTIGAGLQKLQQHPAVRMILPFVRTPTNLFLHTWRRTPGLNRLMSSFREDLAAGGGRKALALAQSELGGFVWASAALLAYNGQITGRGPQDPELRRQWIEAGNQPYSIRIPGTKRWMSFRRGDPVMTSMGIAADMVSMMGEIDETDRSELVYAFMASVAANLSSKTYMQGVVDFMDAASSGRADVVEHLASTTLGSFVPNVLRQVDPNPYIMETRGLVDEVMNRTIGFSSQLEPRRNMFGEKVMKAPGYLNRALNPFVVSGPEQEDVADELLKLGRAFTMPPERKAGGMIDLTSRSQYDNGTGQSPYDRMLELMGNGINGSMPSLREALTKLVRSPEYQAASDGGTIARGGVKYMMASAFVMGYQNAAWGTVLQEYPALIRALTDVGQLKADDLTTLQQDQSLLSQSR